ncbi:MAG: hypothetical protein JWN93_3932 [Hyphomicrobiales bacterium]|nr:hypothetical protein [Hyphomicrobiales bacterium]
MAENEGKPGFFGRLFRRGEAPAPEPAPVNAPAAPAAEPPP